MSAQEKGLFFVDLTAVAWKSWIDMLCVAFSRYSVTDGIFVSGGGYYRFIYVSASSSTTVTTLW